MDFSREKSGSLNKGKVRVSNESSEEPEERFFILVVAFGGDIIVLEVSLSVEGDLSSLYFSVFDVYFVSNEHHRDVFANSG
jgi:hypothetical protein